jgi:RNA polymerase sigma-54 factor
MVLRQKLELRQGQSLVMTPQLQQAIKLLQMSNLEVQAFVESELERNPLLERHEASDDPPPVPGADGASEAPLRHHDAQLFDADPTAEKLPTIAAERPADSGWTTPGAGGSGSEDFNLESQLTQEATLGEHLTNQLNLAIADPARRLIGAHLIGLVDEAGYLTGDLESAAETLGTSLAEVEKVLAILQGFDPTGVFARSLSECLALQLIERDRLDPAMAALLANLELAGKHDWTRLRQICASTWTI